MRMRLNYEGDGEQSKQFICQNFRSQYHDHPPIYVGQTARSVLTRGKEHGNAVTRENWHHSGISAHKKLCKEPINWSSPTVITTKTNKNKRKLNFDLKVREALEIKRRNCGPGQGLNEDFGAYVKTQMWNPVFHHMDRG